MDSRPVTLSHLDTHVPSSGAPGRVDNGFSWTGTCSGAPQQLMACLRWSVLRCRVLGPIQVERSGAPFRVLPRRQRALLARLILARGRAVGFDVLADSVWGDEEGPADVRGALYTLASRLRGALGDGVVTEAAGYALRLPRNAVDAWEFEDGLRMARAADGPAALHCYDRVLACWRGRAYDEFADGFAADESARLEDLRSAAARERLTLLGRSAP